MGCLEAYCSMTKGFWARIPLVRRHLQGPEHPLFKLGFLQPFIMDGTFQRLCDLGVWFDHGRQKFRVIMQSPTFTLVNSMNVSCFLPQLFAPVKMSYWAVLLCYNAFPPLINIRGLHKLANNIYRGTKVLHAWIFWTSSNFPLYFEREFPAFDRSAGSTRPW